MADWRDSMTPQDHAMIAARAPIAPGTLVVLIGPAGSGKTQFTHGVPSREVISLDDLRAQVTGGDAGDQGATPEAVRIQDLLIDARLTRARTLYLDSTNTEVATRAQLVHRARHHGRPLTAIAFTTPLDVCLRRNAERPPSRRVPDEVLRRQHQLAVESLPGLTGEGFDEVRLYPAVSRSGR